MTPRSGLSLFELLISLAFLIAIAVGLSSSLNLGVKLYQKTGGLNEAHVQLLARRTALRRFISHAKAPHQIVHRNLPNLSGSPTEFTFTSIAPTPFSPEAVATIVSVKANSSQLAVAISPIDSNGKPLQKIDQVLLKGFEGVELRYYDANIAPPKWQDHWSENTQYLPALVQILITDDQGLPLHDWPEFTVRPYYIWLDS